MGFSQKRQPTEAAGLNNRQIEIRWLGVSNSFAFLLDKKSQPEIVKLGHGTHPISTTLAVVNDLPTPPDVAAITDFG